MAISKVSYNNTPQAHDDKYQIVSYTGAIKFNVMLNDQGGNSKTMYSIDDGSSPVLNGGPADLLTQDAVSKSTGKSVLEYSHLGAKIWINADGTVSYDAGSLTMPAAGTSVVDSFIYAIRMADGTLSWGTVNVVLGNHAAVVTGPVTGTATEDGPAVALNALANASDDFTTNLGVHFDLSSLPSGVTYDSTTHSFVLDPGNAAYQHLAAGEQTTVTVNYSVWDGYLETPTTASWLVTGVNDAASISGTDTGGVKEDTTLTAAGTVAVSDIDDGENVFQAVNPSALNGTYGTFTFANGVWTYTLANDSDTVQSLGEGVTRTDTLTASTSPALRPNGAPTRPASSPSASCSPTRRTSSRSIRTCVQASRCAPKWRSSRMRSNGST